MTELNLSEQFKNLPPDQQAEFLAKFKQEAGVASIEKPNVKTESPHAIEMAVPGVYDLTEAEKLAASGNIPSDVNPTQKIPTPETASLNLNSSEMLGQALSGDLDLVQKSLEADQKGAGYDVMQALIDRPEQQDTPYKV